MPTKTMSTKFYSFHQNNSGGHYRCDETAGITKLVWIEAMSPFHANERAEAIGIYFDGVRQGLDCGCCGDRWDRQYCDDGVKNPLNVEWPTSHKAAIHPMDEKFYIFDTTKEKK